MQQKHCFIFVLFHSSWDAKKTVVKNSRHKSCSLYKAYTLREDSCTGVFLWDLPNILEHFLFLLSIPYSLRPPKAQNVTFDLGYFLVIIYTYFHSKLLWIEPQTVSCEWIDLLLIKHAIHSNCCWNSEAVAQQSSAKIKMIFCNVVYVMESLFRKTVSSHAWNDTKKITITIENGIAKFFIFFPSEFFFEKMEHLCPIHLNALFCT